MESSQPELALASSTISGPYFAAMVCTTGKWHQCLHRAYCVVARVEQRVISGDPEEKIGQNRQNWRLIN
jgi:hypothetical protein